MIDNVVEILTVVFIPLAFYVAALAFIIVLTIGIIAAIWRVLE
jgi:hypothetical protein